jgi:flagellar biosynthetic protein FliR
MDVDNTCRICKRIVKSYSNLGVKMIDINNLVVYFVLIFCRISGIFFVSPFFSNKAISARIRVGFSFFVSFLLLNVVPKGSEIIENLTFPILTVLVIKELIIGALIGFLVALVFSVVQTASQLYSMNIGLMMANTFDPVSENQVPVLGQLKNLFLLGVFFVYGIHRVIIMRLIDTFYYDPIGNISYNIDNIAIFFIKYFSYYFLLAIQLSLPVLGVLMLIDMILGVLSRIAPQMNVFFIGMPLKLMVGFYVLLKFSPYFVNFFILIFEKLNDRILELVKLSTF